MYFLKALNFSRFFFLHTYNIFSSANSFNSQRRKAMPIFPFRPETIYTMLDPCKDEEKILKEGKCGALNWPIV